MYTNAIREYWAFAVPLAFLIVILLLCKTELANSQNWPITMYRTTELANFAGLANSHANWPIRPDDSGDNCLWCFNWFDLQLSVTESWLRRRHLAVATSPLPLVKT